MNVCYSLSESTEVCASKVRVSCILWLLLLLFIVVFVINFDVVSVLINDYLMMLFVFLRTSAYISNTVNDEI